MKKAKTNTILVYSPVEIKLELSIPFRRHSHQSPILSHHVPRLKAVICRILIPQVRDVFESEIVPKTVRWKRKQPQAILSTPNQPICQLFLTPNWPPPSQFSFPFTDFPPMSTAWMVNQTTVNTLFYQLQSDALNCQHYHKHVIKCLLRNDSATIAAFFGANRT